MQIRLSLSHLAIMPALIFAGCARTAPDPPGDGPPATWVDEGIEHEGTTISLGYRGDGPRAGQDFEPIVMITRDEKPVASAMVFNQLISSDGSESLGEEQATVFELSEDRQRGHYAQGPLQLPAGQQHCTVRFRIVLEDSVESWTRDVTYSTR